MSTPPTDDMGADDGIDYRPQVGVDGETVTVGGQPAAALDTEAALEGSAPETVNLVGQIDETEQKRIADAVFEEYDTDWKSSEKYREKRAQLYRLCFGILPEKQEGYSQIHYSIMLRAVIKLHARVYDQQFPSNGEYWGCRPSSAADLDRCVRVAKHMNWQTLHQIPEYVPNHDSMIMQWYINGDALSFMYWNPVKNRPCHEWLATDDYVLPYAFPREASDPSLSNLPRITRIVRKYRFGPDGLDDLAESGYYDKINVLAMFEGEKDASASRSGGSDKNTENADGPIRQAVDKGSGVEKPGETKTGQRVLLEQHRWWKLPTWDKYRPVIATIDKETKTLLAFILREDEDPEDRARYNREKLANDASYQAAMVQYQRDLAIYMAGMAMPPPVTDGTGMPMPGAPGMTAPPAPGGTTATAPPLMETGTLGQIPEQGETTATAPMTGGPTPPEMPPLPAPPKMVPINFFTHYICIPNPEGIYGYGIGYLLEGNNITADALGSIIVDSGKLSNMPTGFYSRESKLRGGDLKIKPGEFVPVDAIPSELSQIFHQLKFPGPEPQLSNIIKDQMADAEEVSGASEVLSGEVGGSNETATTTQIRISQALAAISIQNKRYTRARTEEGKKLARLNSVYLGDVEYFSEIDPFHNTPPVDRHIARADYLEDTAITVTADPRMASQPQRLQEAMQALQVIMQLAQAAPWLQNPQLIGAAVKNIFVAMDRPDLAAFAAPPPPPPPGAMPPGAPQPGQGAPPPGAGGPPPGGGHPAPQGPRAGQPRPSPQRPGPTVPNGGPTAPASGQAFMGQGQ